MTDGSSDAPSCNRCGGACVKPMPSGKRTSVVIKRERVRVCADCFAGLLRVAAALHTAQRQAVAS